MYNEQLTELFNSVYQVPRCGSYILPLHAHK